MGNLLYRDTRNFIPIDVAKGIDAVTGKKVSADDLAPEGYEAIEKCGNCKNFTPDGEHMGICEASEAEPKFFAYPDMVAVTCEMYKKI